MMINEKTKRKMLIAVSIMIIFSLLFIIQSKYTTGRANAENYPDLWKNADAYYSKGLPQSALKVVEGIYMKAKKDKNSAQQIRALIYKMKYIQEVEEDSLPKMQEFLQAELKDADYPIKPVLHSMLAETLWGYYQQNRYQFLDRTHTVDFVQNDIRTWDLRKIVEEVVAHYQESLQDAPKLQQTALNIYDEIIIKGGKDERNFRPTLYDFLAHRAVDFFMNTEAGLSQPVYQFTLNNKAYLGDAASFAALELTTRDKLSFNYFALKYLQDLTRFHLKDKNPDALIDVELERINFVYKQAVMPDKDKIYENALVQMQKNYAASPLYTDISYYLADFYRGLGATYNPLQDNDNYKWYLKKALEISQEALKKYPSGNGALNCKYLIEKIQTPFLQITTEKANVPDKSFRALVQYRNAKKVYFRAMKIERNDYQREDFDSIEKMVKAYRGVKAAAVWESTLPDDGDYQQHAVEIKVPSLPVGEYIILAADNKDFAYRDRALAYSYISITNIAYLQRTNPVGGYQFYLLDRTSGNPLKDAKAVVWYQKYNTAKGRYEFFKGESIDADKNGYLLIPSNVKSGEYNNYFLQFINGKDTLYTDNSFYNYNRSDADETQTKTFFFTDRAIYRPGQTVYFKGLMLKTDGDKHEILPNQSTNVVLYDVNGQQVSELELKTNEFGTFSGTFTLPTGSLTGQIRISNGSGDTYLSMEEYKRPKFEVTFKPLGDTYRLNDRVNLQGSAVAYAGYKIDNAAVKYRVVRQVFYPYKWFYWWCMPPVPETEILSGSTTTNEDGDFNVQFDAAPDPNAPEESMPAFSYTVYVDVTDMNGETQSSEKSVKVGYSSLILSAETAGEVNKEVKEYHFDIDTTNLDGSFVAANGKITVYKLAANDRVQRKRLWSRPDRFVLSKDEYYANFPNDVYKDEDEPQSWQEEKVVYSGQFDTANDKSVSLKGIDAWDTGKYKVVVEAKDKFGTSVKDVRYVDLFAPAAKTAPFATPDFLTVIKDEAQPGKEAQILLGSAEDNVRVMMEVEHKGEIVKRDFITLDHAQKLIKIPVEEKYRGNFAVHFTFIKNNRVYRHQVIIKVPWSNKKLDIAFETFRNKLQPGQKEEWRLIVKGPDGEKAAAEMVAALYDASLDAFRANNWNFDLYTNYYPVLGWQDNQYFSTAISNMFYQPEKNYYHPRNYDRLNWFGFYWGYGGYRIMEMKAGTAGNVMYDAVPAPMAPLNEKSKVTDMDSSLAKGDVNDSPKLSFKRNESTDKKESSNTLVEPKARTNFNETAFFYPHLQTNEKGEIVIAFTVPESLTRWKMLAFAHTKDLKYGFASNELVTQKELMVVPNAPRFLREGDKIDFTAKITNLADNDINGNVQLMLFDAATMESIDAKFGNNTTMQGFSVKKGKSALATWQLSIPEGYDAVVYRVVAKAGDFSDGEEMALPILRNRILVTESIPLPVGSLQTKEFTFEKLLDAAKSDTLRNYKLTLEYTANPAWYAVQALPYIMEYPYECSEQTFSRYYANSLGAHIVSSNPKIKKIFALWQKDGGTALLSNLEKNQELKSLLLEETPWVMEAKDENERKHRLALLFDTNRLADEEERALKKLADSQLGSGGWPWFKGGYESEYITQHIITGFAHLDRLKVINMHKDEHVWKMIDRALPYLDTAMRHDYEALLKDKVDLKKNHLSYDQIQYLYMRSFFKDEAIDAKDSKAFSYYKEQAQKYWTEFDRYAQGMIGLALSRYGDSKTANAIVKSLKENALHSEEMGMYWKQARGYYWYQAPIETQALLIELFDEVAKDQKSVEEMKTWLLKQKQTQDWGTTKATTEAVYALLLRGGEWLAETKLPVITVGTVKVEPEKMDNVKVEAGTGYFKTSWSASEIKPEMGKVIVTNNNKVPVWGGLYWQYFERLDKISTQQTPLKLVKKLFVERSSDTGPVLAPVTEQTVLKVGDRIKVRIELRVDRDMEFVHLKDMRASGFEPENVLSSYKWQGGLGYYEATRDAATNFFFDRLPKGTYVFEYPLRATHAGDFSNGITTVQCMYAPEFTSHSEGIRVKIKEK